MDASKKRKTDDNGVAIAAGDSVPSPISLTPEIAREILEPLTRDQLLEILLSAVVRHRDVLDAVRPIADADASKRKLFVRGLGWETTSEKLRAVFSSFGEIDEAIVINDKTTGKSKGYGFVTFRHIDGALLALREPSKKIDGRMTVTQLAAAGVAGASAANGVDVSLRKIYVGNIPFEISSERLLDHFSMFGEIEEGPLGFDSQTGKPRGFAFLVYKTEEGARASLVDPIKIIDGHQVNCKLAVDGKKGKTGGAQPTAAAEEFKPPSGAMPMNSNYGMPGGGFPSYGGFSGGPQAMSHQNPHLNSSSVGGPGFGLSSSLGNSGGGYGTGLGGAGGGSGYGGSQYGGLNNLNSGGGSSLYRLPPSSIGMSSGGYPSSGNYGLSNLSSSAYPTQLQQPPPGSRVPPGGMYQGVPPYF